MGSQHADVFWASVEDPDTAVENLEGFIEVARHQTMKDVSKKERDLLEEGLKQVSEPLSKALEATGLKKVVVLLNKSLHSSPLGKEDKGWLHNQVALVFGVQRD